MSNSAKDIADWDRVAEKYREMTRADDRLYPEYQRV